MAEIQPRYRKALQTIAQAITYEGALPAVEEGEDHLNFGAERAGAWLRLQVDGRGNIAAARHQGALGDQRAFLDALCRLAEGRPLRELSEHGLIYLEHELADPTIPHAIRGLLTPENADPLFAWGQSLVRDVYGQYRQTAGEENQKNFWSPRPSPTWMGLGPVDRHKRVQAALLESLKELGLTDIKVELVEITNATRLVLSVAEAASKQAFGHQLMRVERWMKARLEPQLELILESLEDRNKRIGRTHIPRSPEATT